MCTKKDYTVYMLLCSDNSYYIGLTSDVSTRMYQHATGVYETCYTYKRRPVTIVYTTIFEDVFDAISWERRIKRWSRRKKQALITGNEDQLVLYSKRQKAVTTVSNMRRKIRKKLLKRFEGKWTMVLRS